MSNSVVLDQRGVFTLFARKRLGQISLFRIRELNFNLSLGIYGPDPKIPKASILQLDFKSFSQDRQSNGPVRHLTKSSTLTNI